MRDFLLGGLDLSSGRFRSFSKKSDFVTVVQGKGDRKTLGNLGFYFKEGSQVLR